LYDERGVSEPSEELVRFLDAGEPPVVFTPGSAMVHGQQFFAEAAAACQLAGLRGILLTRFASQVPAELPANVRHFDYVPFSWLLPRAAALVHHGGIGTLSQGMAAGIPQVIMPMSFDQPDNAERLKRLGAGTYIWPRQFRAARVARDLTALIESPDVKAACRGIADRIGNDQPLDATCEILERLVEKHAGRATARVPA
jgi:UDP:flavonoid glycosyltransferase YjiC (YdhE family)